jgi:hypothetical protein
MGKIIGRVIFDSSALFFFLPANFAKLEPGIGNVPYSILNKRFLPMLLIACLVFAVSAI